MLEINLSLQVIGKIPTIREWVDHRFDLLDANNVKQSAIELLIIGMGWTEVFDENSTSTGFVFDPNLPKLGRSESRDLFNAVKRIGEIDLSIEAELGERLALSLRIEK